MANFAGSVSKRFFLNRSVSQTFLARGNLNWKTKCFLMAGYFNGYSRPEILLWQFQQQKIASKKILLLKKFFQNYLNFFYRNFVSCVKYIISLRDFRFVSINYSIFVAMTVYNLHTVLIHIIKLIYASDISTRRIDINSLKRAAALSFENSFHH